MLPQVRRAGILLLSVYVDPSANPPWYVRIARPRSSVAENFDSTNRRDIDETVRFVRDWLEAQTSPLAHRGEGGTSTRN